MSALRAAQRPLGFFSIVVVVLVLFAIATAGCYSGSRDQGTGGTAGSGSTGSSSGGSSSGGSSGGSSSGTSSGTGTGLSGTVYVTSFQTNELAAVVLPGATPGNRYATGAMPSDVTIDRAAGIAYVPSLTGQTLERIVLQTSAQSSFLLTGGPVTGIPLLGAFLDPLLAPFVLPTGAAVTPAGDRVFVPSVISTLIVDAQTGAVIDGAFDLDTSAVSPTNPFSSLLAPVRGLGAVRAVASQRYVFVTNALTNNVSVIDTASGDVVANMAVGSFPIGIGYNDILKEVYVCCLMETNLYVLDADTLTFKGLIPVGAGPVDVAVDAAHSRVYVANFLSGDITVVDPFIAAPVGTLAAANMTSLLQAMGLGTGGLQGLFNQFFAALGQGGGAAGTPLGSLLGGFGGLNLNTLLQNTLSQFMTGLPLNGPLPLAGIQGIAVNPSGTAVAVANAFLGQLSVIEVATGNITMIQFGPGFGPASVEIR